MSDAFNEMYRARSKRDGWRDLGALLTTFSFVALIFIPTFGPWPVAPLAISAALAFFRAEVWDAKSHKAEGDYTSSRPALVNREVLK